MLTAIADEGVAEAEEVGEDVANETEPRANLKQRHHRTPKIPRQHHRHRSPEVEAFLVIV